MWYRIEIENYSNDRHVAISQQLRDMGYTVINNYRQHTSWVASDDPRDRLMLPLKLDGCEVLFYESLYDALGSTHYKDFESLRGI